MIQRRYPLGKAKAFNVTYDDGVLQDVPLVALLNRYRLKGTFNLNAQLMEEEFAWTHPSGGEIRRLSPQAAVALYTGHEVASHTLTHPDLHTLPETEIRRQLEEDRARLERLFQQPVRGFALPFHVYTPQIRACVRRCGFAYGRISEESRSFAPPRDLFAWKATLFHTDPALEELTQRFLETEEELALFQLVGHSYDLDTEGMWDRLEGVFRQISAREEVLPMTHLALAEYLREMDRAVIRVDEIWNPGYLTLWFQVDGATVAVPGGGRWRR